MNMDKDIDKFVDKSVRRETNLNDLIFPNDIITL